MRLDPQTVLARPRACVANRNIYGDHIERDAIGLPLKWFPATFTAVDPIQGRDGLAAHVGGDTWRFQYLEPCAWGMKIMQVDVYRTMIQLKDAA